MDLSIIIVNWNSKDYVRQCLASLRVHCGSIPAEIIVVDGGSFDGCDKMLAREFPGVLYVQSPDNIGFARANNLGVRHATGRLLFFLNPDTEFIEDSLQVMLDRLRLLSGAGAVGCRLLNRDRTLQTSCVQAFPTFWNQILDSDFLRHHFPASRLWGTAALHAERPAEVEAISGACILTTRQCFEQAGGFSESYFMYGEDLDLCFKVRRAGFKVFHLPETSLVHFGGGSSDQAASNFSTVMMRESVCRFMQTNRGPFSAAGYRFAMMTSALVRLLLIIPMMPFGNRVVRHGAGSMRKWSAILIWSLGLDPKVKAIPRATIPAADKGAPLVESHGLEPK